ILALMKIFILLDQIKEVKKVSEEKVLELMLIINEILKAYEEENKFCDEDNRNELKKLYNDSKWITNMEMQLFSRIMSMQEPQKIQDHVFYRTDDQDLLAAYKQLYQKLLKSDERKKHQEFMISYHQMITRKSMRCLWKTYPEYNFYFSDWTSAEIKNLKKLLQRTSTPWGYPQGQKQANYSVLSDYVSLPNDTEALWNKLKKHFGLTRLVYVEQDIRTKSFKRYETYLKNQDRVVRLEDIRLYTEEKGDKEFFYIYYEQEGTADSKKEEFTPYNFITEVRNQIQENHEPTENIEKEEDVTMDKHGNMIIRDNVHGDIVFPPLFRALVDTKEFQRLRRIKQLATAGLVFPGAVHTRFSHSIGTYHIMGKILDHFKDYFKRLNYKLEMDDIEEKAILAAALLHDIGHGPYSHAFEKAKLPTGKKTHDQWTVEIILNRDTEVNQILKKVDAAFPEMVVKYIRSENNIKNGDGKNLEIKDEKLNLKFIFASLVSGQLDADRLDYLLRDAEFSGVTYGQYDLEKVVESMAVSVENTGRYRLCILEDFMPAVEEYYYARFQMYSNIYYHPYKMFSEELLRRLLKVAQESYLDGKLQVSMVPPSLENVFNQANVEIDTYCQLDDTVVDGAARIWARSGIQPLSYLCQAHLERRGYCYLDALDAGELSAKAEQIFGKDVWNKYHFLIRCPKSVEMYESGKPLYVLKKVGFPCR
ncbi:MAG: HD domain-containing protein, partial [Ruminococcus flavefaciens]|nr:HD domain-containing protein [Ruminococcus flavefaciens]